MEASKKELLKALEVFASEKGKLSDNAAKEFAKEVMEEIELWLKEEDES